MQKPISHPLTPLRVGSVIVARQANAICKAGTRGVCYEVYEIENRPGYSFIFENSFYDGFSLDDLAPFFEPFGHCEALEDYQFTHVGDLMRDFKRGHFEVAFE